VADEITLSAWIRNRCKGAPSARERLQERLREIKARLAKIESGRKSLRKRAKKGRNKND
jgi:hypothetical protein